MSRYYFSCLIAITLVIGSQAVSVRPDRNQDEPIKPSPIDRTQQIHEKSLISLDPTIDNSNSSKSKREHNEDDKSDVKFGNNLDQREKEIRKYSGAYGDTDKFSHCCGARFEVSGRPSESGQFTTRPSDSDRYPNRFGNRPDDRYGWQNPPGRPGGPSLSSGSLYGSQGNPPNRYGWRPPYGSSVDSDYGRPPGGIRPSLSRPGYNYGDSGAYGSSGFETSRPGIHITAGPRPGSGYGIHGTIGEQDEFPGDVGPVDTPPLMPPNIHTQKAVALKALAGVALLGAAAALATNPVLLPVGILAGRRKRAIENAFPSDDIQFLYGFLKAHVPGIDRETTSEEFWKKPTCIARLTCELQQHYLRTMKNDKSLVQKAPILKQRLEKQMQQLIKRDIFKAEDINYSLQQLRNIPNDKVRAQNSCSILDCGLYVS
ncbi:uncharacterized protein [Fopius arisanus]|uniref:Uncharacterized protein isoform X2 n=1 Tax=Fopius arisanus TaxID=64838 RepID=A0A9R1T947_9HYME|nr:PREDICTED: uncharacterized protein LOC105267664 isoform X2 [Fopius arisanus]